MGFREREQLVPEPVRELLEKHPRGRFEGIAGVPTLLVDGVVVGLWRRSKLGKRIAILVEPARRLSAEERRLLETEVERIGAFFDTEPKLQVGSLERMSRGYVMQLGLVPYAEAWELQRSLAGEVSRGTIPDTVVLLEHPPVITLGRRAEEHDLHVPEGAGGRDRRDRPRREVDLPRARAARLLPDPRPAPARPGRQTLLPGDRGGADPDAGAAGVEATRIEGLHRDLG